MAPEIEEKEKERLRETISEMILEFDGAGSKSGQYVNYVELHPLQIGASLITLGYLISAWALVAFLVIGGKAVKDVYFSEKPAKHLIRQIGLELHYYLGAGAVVAVLFEFAGHSPPDFPISMAIIFAMSLGL